MLPRTVAETAAASAPFIANGVICTTLMSHMHTCSRMQTHTHTHTHMHTHTRSHARMGVHAHNPPKS
jgi:hypothetical protein